LPRLCYVTDAGDNETTYCDKVLSRMRHPRTGAALEWIRVVDYYHASERVWTLADLLFGKGRRGAAWAWKMQKWLLQAGSALLTWLRRVCWPNGNRDRNNTFKGLPSAL
jgi:hypothetical protein